MIYRADHSDGHFVQILNSVFWDPRISLKAKGMVGLLLTMPSEDFSVSRDRLTAIGPDGARAIRSVLKELADVGYFDHRLVQDEHGRWRTEVDLYEDPKLKTEGAFRAIGKRTTDGAKRATVVQDDKGDRLLSESAVPRRRKAASIRRTRNVDDGRCQNPGCDREEDYLFEDRWLCESCYCNAKIARAQEQRRSPKIENQPDLRSWLLERIGWLRDNQPDVYAALRSSWPPGVPTLKASDAHDAGQLERIRDVVVAVSTPSTNGQGVA